MTSLVPFSYAATLVTGLFFWLFVAAFFARKWREGPWSVEGLVPSPAPSQAFPIEFTLFADGLCTGRDQGVASFVEGWLHVEGLRTNFSLRPADAVRKLFTQSGHDHFDLPGGQGVVFRPLASAFSDRAIFSEEVRKWHRLTVPSPSGNPVLPPSRIHASAFKAPLDVFVAALLVFLGLLALSAWILVSQPHESAIFMPIFVAGAVAVGFIQKASHDLGRLRRHERRALREDRLNAFTPWKLS